LIPVFFIIKPFWRGSELPKYSIIIPTYSNLENLKPCLESVIETSIDPEIIVVDNGSFDGTSAYLEFMHKRYAHFLKVITLDTNKGYAGAINIGIKEARGLYIVSLNDDVITTPKWNLYLSEAIESYGVEYGKIGIISPRTNYAASHCLINEEESRYLGDPWGLAGKIHQQFGKAISVAPWVPGFAMMIRRELIENIGGFDERYFPGGFEDNDFCTRAWHAGYRTAVAEGVFVLHTGSVTFKRFYPEMNIGLNNLSIYLKKWRESHSIQSVVLASYLKDPSAEAIQKIQALADSLGTDLLLEVEKNKVKTSAKSEKESETEGINKLLTRAHDTDADWIFFVDSCDDLDSGFTAQKLRELINAPDPLATIYAFPLFKIYQNF
jgi:GT2 family glycosyltransferase